MQSSAMMGQPLLGRASLPRPARASQGKVMAGAIEQVLETGTSAKPDVPKGLNKYSSRITQPKSQGASQAMLYGTGLTEADMNKPQVGARASAGACEGAAGNGGEPLCGWALRWRLWVASRALGGDPPTRRRMPSPAEQRQPARRQSAGGRGSVTAAPPALES